MESLLKNAKITRILVDTVAGQAATASDILDMSGFQSVMFIAKLGDVTNGSVVTLACQQNTINSASGMATLTGTATYTSASTTDADDNLLVLDVVKPNERYVRASASRPPRRTPSKTELSQSSTTRSMRL